MSDETEKTPPLKTLEKIMYGCAAHTPFHHADCMFCVDTALHNVEGHREEVLQAFKDITDALHEPFEEIVKTMTSVFEELGRLFDSIQEVSGRVTDVEKKHDIHVHSPLSDNVRYPGINTI